SFSSCACWPAASASLASATSVRLRNSRTWSTAWVACCPALVERASEPCTRRASSWMFFWLHCQSNKGPAMATTSASTASQSAPRPDGFDDPGGFAATAGGGLGGAAEALDVVL